jgi:hypothetical protein
MDPAERAYLEGQRDAYRTAIVELERGGWWHLRDWLAHALHWLAMRVEPKT